MASMTHMCRRVRARTRKRGASRPSLSSLSTAVRWVGLLLRDALGRCGLLRRRPLRGCSLLGRCSPLRRRLLGRCSLLRSVQPSSPAPSWQVRPSWPAPSSQVQPSSQVLPSSPCALLAGAAFFAGAPSWPAPSSPGQPSWLPPSWPVRPSSLLPRCSLLGSGYFLLRVQFRLECGARRELHPGRGGDRHLFTGLRVAARAGLSTPSC